MKKSELTNIIKEEMQSVMLEQSESDVYLQKARARLDGLKMKSATGNTEQKKNLDRFGIIYDTMDLILLALEESRPKGKGE
jgi:hypothetical protein